MSSGVGAGFRIIVRAAPQAYGSKWVNRLQDPAQCANVINENLEIAPVPSLTYKGET